ncbi:MAG: ATP-binding protein [Oscillospiraceae bacterium]|jgi:signal transduction histidine kinase|nr:ATP-binding protein [Oscillospiraceae bacterium]
MFGIVEQISIYANGLILVGMMYYAFTCNFKPAVKKIWIIISYLSFILLTTGLFLFFNNIWITLVVNIATYICLSFLFTGNVGTKIIFSMLIYITSVLAEGFSAVFFNTIHYIQYGVETTVEDILPIARTVATVIHLPLVFITIQTFRRYVIKRARYSSFRIPAKYTAIVAFMLVGVVLLSAIFIYSSLDEIHSVVAQLTTALFLSAGVIVAVIWLYNRILHNLETLEKNKHKEQMLERWELLYHTATSSQKTISKLKHNIRFDLLSIFGYLEKGNISKVNQLIRERIGEVDVVISTGNISIDTMLNYYQQKANDALGTEMELELLIPPNLNIDANMIALILGNALENAIEACLKVSEDQRFIKVTAELTTQSELFLIIMNPYTVEPICDNEGNLITIKDDKLNHGFGLSSITDVLSEDTGQVHVEYCNGIFRFMLVYYKVIP